jgi:hypothetical protein
VKLTLGAYFAVVTKYSNGLILEEDCRSEGRNDGMVNALSVIRHRERLGGMFHYYYRDAA